MANLVAVKGSTSSHGGVVITGNLLVTVNGKEVACLGDLHSCPLPGHGITPISSNCIGTILVDGKPIAQITSICGCGASIISGENMQVE